MKKLIAPVGLIGASVLLGMGLMIGANIGAAVLKLAAPGLRKYQEKTEATVGGTLRDLSRMG